MDDQILIRFLTHRCTPEEVRQIDQWIASDKRNAEHLFEMEHLWSLKNTADSPDEAEIEAACREFLTKIHRKNNRFRIIRLCKYAAVFALIALLSIDLYVWWGDSTGMNIIEVPRGELVSLTLSDGSKVWLNADTRFSYPTKFASGKREVSIEGEGFFEVAHHKKPFIVQGELFKLKVLGTEFNVKAHTDEEAEISLKSGKIEVGLPDSEKNNIVMHPNEQMRYTTNGEMIHKKVDTHFIDSWRNGGITFISQPLGDIMKTLERKYKVTITLAQPELSNTVFTCRARMGASLEDVLILLQDTKIIDYTFENKNHVLIFKHE